MVSMIVSMQDKRDQLRVHIKSVVRGAAISIERYAKGKEEIACMEALCIEGKRLLEMLDMFDAGDTSCWREFKTCSWVFQLHCRQ